MNEKRSILNYIRSLSPIMLALVVIATLSTLISIATLQVVPITGDLYNLIYEGYDLAKEESTFVFLFFFPVIQICFALIFQYLTIEGKSVDGKGFIAVIASIGFLIINAWRCFDAWMKFA